MPMPFPIHAVRDICSSPHSMTLPITGSNVFESTLVYTYYNPRVKMRVLENILRQANDVH